MRANPTPEGDRPLERGVDPTAWGAGAVQRAAIAACGVEQRLLRCEGMGRAHLLLVVMLLAVSREGSAKPSCGQGGGTGQSTATAGAGQFKLSVPSSYSPTQAIPLLLALHGDEGTPDYIYSVFLGLQKTSSGAFILVAPKAPAGGGSWYQAVSEHVTFVNAVLSSVLATYNIDLDRIWITGWSGGATFLGYYAILRQDLLAAVVYHMGGGGGGSYSPPAGSCKIPARFVIGSADFLYSLAKTQYNTLTSKGHETVWVELPGVAHTFEPSTLPETWAWLKTKSLCGTTTPGSCGPKPDAAAPSPRDAGVLSPELGAGPRTEVGAPPSVGTDALVIDRDGRFAQPGEERDGLGGGCVLAAPSRGELGSALLVLLVLVARCRRRR